MIPLLQTKTADTAHTGFFASNTSSGPFPNFWVGPGDKGSSVVPYYELMKTGWGAEDEAKKKYSGPEN